MHHEIHTRRDLLLKCAALGVLKIAPPLPLETVALAQERSAESRKATPWNEIGPFYNEDVKVNALFR